MNPSSNLHRSSPFSPRGIVAPQPRPIVSDPARLRTEVVNQIPVKNPISPVPYSQPNLPALNPIDQVNRPLPVTANSEDKDLDSALHTVNDSIKRTENDSSVKSKMLKADGQKKSDKQIKTSQTHHSSPPIVATALALAVASVLCFAALKMMK